VGEVVGRLVVGRAAGSVRDGVSATKWYAPAHNENGNNANMWFKCVHGITDGYANDAKNVYWEARASPAPSPATDPLICGSSIIISLPASSTCGLDRCVGHGVGVGSGVGVGCGVGVGVGVGGGAGVGVGVGVGVVGVGGVNGKVGIVGAAGVAAAVTVMVSLGVSSIIDGVAGVVPKVVGRVVVVVGGCSFEW
jgi:hypothetical protein